MVDGDLEMAADDGRPRAGDTFVPALVRIAAEVTESFAGWRLSAAERDRIYLEAHRLFDAGMVVPARGRPGRIHLGRHQSAVVGGAVVASLAAIGVALVHERRSHTRPLIAGAPAH